MMKFDRRTLILNAMGGGLFLPSLLGDKLAYGAVPKRLFIYYTRHGPNYWDWSMRPAGSGPDKTADWEVDLNGVAQAQFSPILKHLYAHRSDLLVLDGLANTAAFASKGTNNHNAGTSTILTGASVAFPGGFANEGTGGGPSIDQIIGKKVLVPGRKETLYATTSPSWSPIHSGLKMELQGASTPGSLYLQVRNFQGQMMTSGGGGTPAKIDPVLAARASLPDLVRPEYQSLVGKLSGEDKRKLQDHMDLMNNLQLQLKGQLPMAPGQDGGPTIEAACNFEKPEQPLPHFEKAEIQNKILVAALACGVTNVAIENVGQPGASELNAPSSIADIHQDAAHQSSAPGSIAAQVMLTYYEKHAQQFGRILDMMKSVKEGNGTLLDNTVVLWVNELANGPHDMFRIRVVMAGSGSGYFKTGRYIKYQETYPNPATFGYGGGKEALGPAHNKLLVSLMQYMGLPDNSIGISSATGSGYKAGQNVEMTGPLARLRP